MAHSGSSKLSQILADMNTEGGFSISVLTDAQGLAIAYAAENRASADNESAVVAFAQKAALQVGRQLGFGGADEITFNGNNGQKLICRMFKVNQDDLILAVMTPARATAYRRATNSAIRQISATWKEFLA